MTGMRVSNAYVSYSTLTTSIVPLCRLLLRQLGLLVILLYWTCLVACSPSSVLEHCFVGTWRTPLGSSLLVPSCAWSIALSALATRLHPLDAVCVCRLLAVFLVHAGITIIFQTQFIPGPCSSTAEKFLPGVS